MVCALGKLNQSILMLRLNRNIKQSTYKGTYFMYKFPLISDQDPNITVTYTHKPTVLEVADAPTEYLQLHYYALIERRKINDWGWCDVTVTVTWLGLSASEILQHMSFSSEEEFKNSSNFNHAKVKCFRRIEKAAKVIAKEVTKNLMPQLIDYVCSGDPPILDGCV